MADTLDAIPEATGAAVDTRALIADLQVVDAIEARIRALADVWHAVEWWHSLDWSRDQAMEAIARYEAGREPAPAPAAVEGLIAEARTVLRLLEAATREACR
jgi:hypothetical protein